MVHIRTISKGTDPVTACDSFPDNACTSIKHAFNFITKIVKGRHGISFIRGLLDPTGRINRFAWHNITAKINIVLTKKSEC